MIAFRSCFSPFKMLLGNNINPRCKSSLSGILPCLPSDESSLNYAGFVRHRQKIPSDGVTLTKTGLNRKILPSNANPALAKLLWVLKVSIIARATHPTHHNWSSPGHSRGINNTTTTSTENATFESILELSDTYCIHIHMQQKFKSQRTKKLLVKRINGLFLEQPQPAV